MATDIKVKVGIDGEKQFRQSIKEINSELKLLKSEMKTVVSSYDGQANSMNALTAKQKVYEQQIETTKNKIKTLKEALEKAKDSFGENSSKVSSWQIQLNNAQAELNELNVASMENQRYLDEAASAADGCATSIDKYGDSVKRVKDSSEEAANAIEGVADAAENASTAVETAFGTKLSGRSDAFSDSVGNLAHSMDQYDESARIAQQSTQSNAEAVDTLAAALAAAGLTQALSEIAQGMRECVDASVEFESAIAGVAKTTDLNEDELASMTDAIKEMATQMPATTTEIAGVVEAAGQLGIAKDDLLDFAEVMVNLGVATNLTSDEAASALAKFANVVDMSADDYERLGSTIVDLGNNFATTEADIVSMATRLASAGSTVGLTEPQIMAVATALSSVGIEAEAGGSAISKLLKQFETMVATGDDSLASFAEIAGMSAEEFSTAWGEDAVGALSQFIDGLGQVDAQGGSMVAVLEELGIKETRLSNAVQALASSNGILNEAVSTANTAWKENTALTKEAETRYATTESKAQMLANAFNNVKIAVGDQLTPALQTLYDVGTDAAKWAADFVEQNEWLVPILSAVVTTLGLLTAGVTAYVTWTKIAATVTAAFNAVMGAMPVVAIATALGALVGNVVSLSNDTHELNSNAQALVDSANSFKTSMDEANSTMAESQSQINATATVADSLAEKLEKLEANGLDSADAQQEYAATVKQLNSLIPELNLQIDEQTGTIEKTNQSLTEQIALWKENAMAQAKQNAMQDLYDQWAEANTQLLLNQTLYNDALAESETQARNIVTAQQEQAALQEQIAAAEAPGYERQLSDDEVEHIEALKNKYQELEGSIVGYQEAQSTATQNALDYEEAINEAQPIVEEYAYQVEAVSEAWNESSEASEEAGETATNATEQIMTSMDALSEAYQAAYNAAAESLGNTVGLWTEMDNTAVTSVDSIKETLASQVEWFTSYRENLDALASRQIPGVDTSALIASLNDGTTESAAILAGLSSATDEEIAEVVAAMGESDTARAELTDAMAQASSEFQTEMDSIVQSATDMATEIDQSEQATTSGQNTINGYIAGIDSRTSALYAKMRTVAYKAWQQFRSQMEERSPSRVAMRSGRNTIEGYILGVEDKEDELNDVMTEMAEKVTEALPEDSDAYDSAKDFMDAYKSAIKEYAGDIQDTIDDLTKAQESMMSKLQDYGKLEESTTASALKEQVEMMTKYSEVLNALRDRGADSDLMTEVVGMGIEDAVEYASQLNAMTDEAWAEYMSAWQEKQALAAKISEEYYAGDLAEQTEALNSVLANAMADIKGDGHGSGANYVKGLIEGMQSQQAALTAKAEELAAAMTEALNEALGIHSPSKVAMEIMGHFGDGLMLGWDDSITRLQNTIESSIPQQVIGPVEKSFDAAPIITAMENTASGIVNGIAATQATNSKPVQLRVDLDGRELAEGIVDPLRKTLRRRNEKL